MEMAISMETMAMEMEMGEVDVEEMAVTTTAATTSGPTLRSSRGSCYRTWILEYPKTDLRLTYWRLRYQALW